MITLRHLSLALALSLQPAWALACDDACKIAAVEQYLASLLTHDASNIPLAPQVRRIENNRLNADGAAALRKDLETSSKYKVIRGLRDKQLYVAGDDVFAIFTVDAGLGALGQIASGRTFERFRIIKGQITQIEVVVFTSLGKVAQPPWAAD
jgi:3'(2'), 5'-bisphosphate nucleotidase